MYTVKDLSGNQMEGVSLEKSQTYDMMFVLATYYQYFDTADLTGVFVVNSS